ncbi:hypothetical protein GGR52DRAFT_457642 [Hypoxylon sp. FL1284]|nr:hypothetical protein GGR52DRAFT_457642 [Hypoxylon sp. FL1284]
MQLLSLLLLCLSALQPALAALDVSGVPECGSKCIQTSAVNSDCAPTDTTCICTNDLLQAQITECVMATCSVRDQLATKKYSYESCGLQGEDRTGLVWIIAIVFGSLGFLAFVLRCVARLIGPHDWGHDDTVMCVAVAFMIALAALSIPLSQNGLGLDMWFVPHDSITEVLRLYYFDELIYITVLSLTKISILFFYLKVFPKRWFRICAYGLIIINVVYAVAYVLLLVFQCNPISGAWTQWDGETPSQCISINVLGWSAAAINIALDLAVIILPLPELLSLSLSFRKKVQIMAMFAVGFFITVVSVVRLYSLIKFGTTTNVTQDYVETGYWSTIEVPVGIICACMPAVRSLFSLALPKVFGSTQRGHSAFASYGPDGSGNRLGPDARRINVKQEWSVLSEGANDSDHEGHERQRHARNESDLELLNVGVAMTNNTNMPTRKMTLSKRDGEWRGMTVAEERNETYKSPVYTWERELR